MQAFTAIELKKVIDKIENHGLHLGKNKSSIYDKEKEFDDCEEANPGKKRKSVTAAGSNKKKGKPLVSFGASQCVQLNDLHSRFERDGVRLDLPGNSYTVRVLNQPFEINGGFRQPDTDKQVLKSWFTSEHATVSGFGNQNLVRTEVDENVRKARELGPQHVEVDPKLIPWIQEQWVKQFHPAPVRAEFYKMNLYEKGGKFKAHRDTPEKNLLGTAVVVLASTQGSSYANDFLLGTKAYSMSPGNVFLFWTDTLHEVYPVTQEYRATLTFKLFARSSCCSLKLKRKNTEARLQIS